MKKYYVTVNGNRYEVEVEEVKGDFEPAPVKNVQKVETKKEVEAPKAVVEEKKIEQAPVIKNSTAEGEKIECPMPGTILKININPGSSVKKGDVMFILEAMKMENEIMAPQDAKVIEVNVSKGASVNTGDILAVLQ